MTDPGIGHWMLTADGQSVWIDQASADILGMAHDEAAIALEPLLATLSPGQSAELHQSLADCRRTGQSCCTTIDLVGPQRLSVTMRATRLGQNVVVSLEPLTSSLINPDDINTLFVEHAPAAIAIFDNQLHYLAASKRWITDYGLTGKQIIGSHHYDLFPEIRTMPEWVAVHQQCLAGATEICTEDHFVREDGSEYYIHWEIHPWHTADGSVGGIIMFTQEISEQVEARLRLEQAQKELLRTEDRLRLTTDAGGIGLWDWDCTTNALVWNDHMFQLFGVDRTSYSGTVDAFKEAIHPDDMAATIAVLEAALAGRAEYRVEYRTTRPDHPSILAIGTVYRDPDGTPTRMVGVCIEVTDQVTLRTKLAAAKAHAESLVTAKDQFLAAMSHEIRTPLNGVIGMTDLLSDTELDQQQQEFTNTIRSCGANLLVLINDVLDFAKLEADAVTLETLPLSVPGLIDECCSIVKPAAAEKGLRLDQAIDSSLPDRLLGDPTRIKQILLNLLNNSIKFTAQGAVTIAVSTTAIEAKLMSLTFTVTDTGIGMTPTTLETIFQPFTQADASTTRRYGGTGLGLSICKHLTELMGGTICLTSTPGTGTTAALTLTLECDQRSAAGAEDTGPEPSCSPFASVLIAEDHPVNQQVISHLMRGLADRVVIANDGQEAVRQYAAERFELILMDCQMPHLDGFAATKAIRHIEATNPRAAPALIVALTANAMTGDRQQCLAAGMDGYLAKPVTKRMLLAELARQQAHRRNKGP